MYIGNSPLNPNPLPVAAGGTGAPTVSGAQISLELVPGVNVEAFDPNTAKVNSSQTYTGAPRTSEVTDNDGSFSLSAGVDFKCTPSGNFTLTFTDIPASPVVQKGTAMIYNPNGYTASAAPTTKISLTALAKISAAGTYELAYRTDGTNVYVTAGAFV